MLMKTAILSFAAGILFCQLQASLPDAWVLALVGLAGLVLAVLCFRMRGATVRLALSVAAGLLLGLCWSGTYARWQLADELPQAWEGRDLDVIGVVRGLPQRFDRGERFGFDVEQVLTPGAIVPRQLSIAWYRAWNDVGEHEMAGDGERAGMVHPGERWRLTVRLKRPHGNINPAGFDYEAYLLERGIRATGTVRFAGKAQRLAAQVWGVRALIDRLRETIRGRFLDTLPDAPYAGVLVALAIGDQRSIPNGHWQVFNRTGVTHLVSISGLHVTMFAALCGGFVNLLWRRSRRLMHWVAAQQAAIVGGWLGALFYTALAGFEVPAQRTLYMLSVVALASCSGRNFGASRVLLMAMGVVLLTQPLAVLSTGFWLSFGAVAILFYAGSARGDLARGWRDRLRQWGLAQWAVTVGSLPLLLLFFQQFSLVSPLANALAIPLISLVVTPLALLFALIPWAPLAIADHWILSQLMTVLQRLAEWPVWQQASPPGWSIVLALGGALWLLLPRGFPARWLGLCLMAPAIFVRPSLPESGQAWIDVLDVGQGLAVVVRTQSHTLLYDTGPAYGPDSNAMRRVVLPYLRAVGVRGLDTLVVSHRDRDHSSGLDDLLQEMPVTRLLTSMERLPGQSVGKAGIEACREGQSWSWDGVRFAVLHPDARDYGVPGKTTNAMSCVLRVVTQGAPGSSALLGGDIDAASETRLVARAFSSSAQPVSTLSSDVLIVPHHGGRASSSEIFVQAVGAKNAVFSVGYRNAFQHPNPEVLERYVDARVWRTDRDGAILIRLGKNAHLSSARADRLRYWYALE